MLAEAASATRSVLSLRAGVVIGAGSTSFEVIRQLATLLLVQPVPSWLEHKVQPIAASDVLRAMVEAFADDHAEPGAVDIGGPDVLPYSEPARGVCPRGRAAARARADPAGARRAGRASAAAALSAAPFWTVTALDREPAPRHGLPPGRHLGAAEGGPLIGVREAMARPWPGGSSPEAGLPSDPDWTRMRAPVLDELHAPATVRAGASLALRRVRSLLSLV